MVYQHVYDDVRLVEKVTHLSCISVEVVEKAFRTFISIHHLLELEA